MFYFVEINETKIHSKHEVSAAFELPEGYREVTESIYSEIGSLPCSFTEVDEEIASIEFIALPEPMELIKPPTEEEILRQQLDEKSVQVDELNLRLSELETRLTNAGL